MDDVTFTESAFHHGFMESDFHEMLAGYYIKIRSRRGLYDIYEIFGQNLAGDYIHAIYRRDKATKPIKVFHMNTMTAADQRRYKKGKR